MILHAGLVACFLKGRWRGVLISGASGAGKSDLALRLIESGWALVADDRTLVWTCEGAVFGRAPDSIAGLIEIRGLGVHTASQREFAEVVLAARCAETADIERIPDPAWENVAGTRIPAIDLAPLEPSAPAKLGRALESIGHPFQQAYQTPRAGDVGVGRRRGSVDFPT